MKYYFPNTYEVETLSKPETYSKDDNLARICRHIIAPTLDMPIGEAKCIFRPIMNTHSGPL